MMRNWRRFFVSMAVVIALAVTMVPLVPPMPSAQAQLFGTLSEEQEIQLGRQVEAEVAKKRGFVNDPGLTQYVTSIGLRLARVSERPNLPWTYHIVRQNDVNAFAVLGGFVFVDRGLLSFVKSEDELAFVLAHETTHVAHRHAVDLAQKDMELQFGAVLLTKLLFGGSMTAYQLTQIARALMDAKYSREKEFEADHYGVIYAQKAGFNPTASIAFFERLQRMEKTQSGLAHAFEDHPDTPERIQALRAQLRGMGYQVAGPVEPPAPSAPAQAPPPQPVTTPSSAPKQPPSVPTSRYPYGDK